jgi:hypothetical protein
LQWLKTFFCGDWLLNAFLWEKVLPNLHSCENPFPTA